MRDLDELLDPEVSRKASAAARTPDFAAVERRGQQRRRRARAVAVGAVVAVAAVVSVVGSQVASYRSDTAPATPPGFDDSDGRLARVVGSGNAYTDDVAMTDAGATLATWIHFKLRGPTIEYGFSLAVGDETYWSPMDYGVVETTPLAGGAFVLGTSPDPDARPSYSLVDDDKGIRPLKMAAQPADLESRSYEGYALLSDRPHGATKIFAVDVETETAAPVAQLANVTPYLPDPSQLPQTDDGALWVVDRAPDGPQLVYLTSDGAVFSYRLPPGSVRDDVTMSLRAMSVSPDGRPILLWVDGRPGGENGPRPPLTLQLSTVTGSTVHTFDYLGSTRLLDQPSAAALPDGRLLIRTGRSLLLTTDSGWRQAADVDLSTIATYEELRNSKLSASDDGVCLLPYNRTDPGFPPHVAQCTESGETWYPVDLTP